MDNSICKKRLYAMLIDGIMVLVFLLVWLLLIYLLQQLLGLYEVKSGPQYVIKMILNFTVLFILSLITLVYLPSLTKTTMGKWIMGLRIEPVTGKITFGRILFRSLFKLIFYSTIIGMVIDYMLVIILKRNAIHDRLLRTTVVNR